MNQIDIISIERNRLLNKNLITVLLIFKKRKFVKNILTDENFTDKQIINYLQNLKYEN
jgi:hypothetical protein